MKKQEKKPVHTRKQRNIKEKHYLDSDRLDSLLEEEGRGAAAKLAAELNVEPQAISNYRRGMADPTMDNLIKIAEHYHVSVDWLLGRLPLKNKSDNEIARNAAEYTGLSSEAVEKLHDYIQEDNHSTVNQHIPEVVSSLICEGKAILDTLFAYEIQAMYANEMRYTLQIAEKNNEADEKFKDLLRSKDAFAAMEISPGVLMNTVRLSLLNEIDEHVSRKVESQNADKSKRDTINLLTSIAKNSF